MSDYSPTHWLKDSGENFHCMPDKKSLFNPEKGCVRGRDNVIPITSLLKPEKWAVDKMLVRNTIDALQSGLEHTRSALTEHDSSLGRTTRKNRSGSPTRHPTT